jgi:hypothetical protein
LLHLANNFLVLAMPTIFGVKPIPFFHISPNILISFLLTYMLTKRIPFRSKQLIFPCSGNILKDNRWIQANTFIVENHILKTENLTWIHKCLIVQSTTSQLHTHGLYMKGQEKKKSCKINSHII